MNQWAEPVTSERVVVVAVSAGGLEPLRSLLSELPSTFPAAILVVQHRGPDHPELLPQLLGARTKLKVRHAVHGELLEPGTVYVCPPGVHMTTEYALRLVEGPKLGFVRPSADLLLRSAVRTHGSGVIGVVLSGAGSDGAHGSARVLRGGGRVLVQEPSSCVQAAMPLAALALAPGGQVVPIAELGPALERLVVEPRSAPIPSPTKVLLADDHPIMLDGLRTLLGAEPDLEVVAEASDGHSAVRLAQQLMPDVVVMDIAMPRLDGIEATRLIRTLSPLTSVVALSACSDRQTASRMLDAGAAGFLDKNEAFSELARAIRTVAAGHPYVRPRA